ncbi:hypothetical protein uav_042 [Pseudomonas phage UAVern]|uniref:Uncharacterized protein n=1 Tax=Pseudomonas phage UAVern TaxID=2856997 RepID=A0A975UUQ1_9CAUD|nr:hypothetical protein uav_042 [Pseudomonas phage UAVern]
MVAVMCMLWVLNTVLACTNSNRAWAANSIASCVLTVILVGVLV